MVVIQEYSQTKIGHEAHNDGRCSRYKVRDAHRANGASHSQCPSCTDQGERQHNHPDDERIQTTEEIYHDVFPGRGLLEEEEFASVSI